MTPHVASLRSQSCASGLRGAVQAIVSQLMMAQQQEDDDDDEDDPDVKRRNLVFPVLDAW